MDKIIALQLETLDKVSKGRVNFKKAPKDRIVMGYVESRLETLEKYWNTFNNNHDQLVGGVAIQNRQQVPYFQNSTYEELEELYYSYKVNTPAALQPQPQGLIVETGNGASVLQLPATTLEQIRHIAADPGASTLRLPPTTPEPPTGARELDFDLCYVCKHCKVAFPSPGPLQAHQARSCYMGREAARGVIRVVQPALECRACPGERFRSAVEFRRHAESEAHARNAAPPPPPPPPEPLTHEMEDVVNQITLLAARAAQESTAPKDSGANFCVPGPRFPPPSELPLASAGH